MNKRIEIHKTEFLASFPDRETAWMFAQGLPPSSWEAFKVSEVEGSVHRKRIRLKPKSKPGCGVSPQMPVTRAVASQAGLSGVSADGQ